MEGKVFCVPFHYLLLVLQSTLSGCISMRRVIFFFAVLVFSVLPVFANSAPVVSNVTVSQRTDGSKLVDIRYNLYDADNDKCTISVKVSSDGGSTWTVPAVSFTGAIGSNITPGTGKLIIWDSAFFIR